MNPNSKKNFVVARTVSIRGPYSHAQGGLCQRVRRAFANGAEVQFEGRWWRVESFVPETTREQMSWDARLVSSDL